MLMKKNPSKPSNSTGKHRRGDTFLALLGVCVGAVPYILGPLVARPQFTTPEHYRFTIEHYTERSVVFFAFVILLNLLIGTINRRKKTIGSTLTILLLGLTFLVVLAKAKYTYQTIPGAFFSLLVIMALLPLQSSLRMQKKWRRHATCVIFTSFFIAISSITIHYAESPFFGLIVGVITLSPEVAFSSLLNSMAPILLALAGGALGAVYGLLGTNIYEHASNVRPELNGTPQSTVISDIPIWYATIVMILLSLPPISLGLLAVEDMLPGVFRFAYCGIAIPVVLQSQCRDSKIPHRNFTKGAYFAVLILLVFLITLGLING